MNDYFLQYKYANLLASSLTQFKVKTTNPFLATMRCPYCGDSQKNKYKSRGYLFDKKGSIGFFCHNCGKSASLDFFLKSVNPILHNDYKFEAFGAVRHESVTPELIKWSAPCFDISPFSDLKRISQMEDHPARKYVESRLIPEAHYNHIFYTPKFMTWVNTLVPDKFSAEALKRDEPRLILPFYDSEGEPFGFQGRSFRKDGIRYITIMLKDQSKIFGMDRIDPLQTVYVVEGPIDSMFLDNAVAMAGSDGGCSISNCVYVFDNEPRNPEIVEKLDKYIEKGYNVMIWSWSAQKKIDINDLILSGWTTDRVQDEFRSRTFRGMRAKVELNDWKKT